MWMLGVEAASLMVLRMARIAAGGSAGTAEAELMVMEKLRAAIELQGRLMTGALGYTSLSGTQGAPNRYESEFWG